MTLALEMVCTVCAHVENIEVLVLNELANPTIYPCPKDACTMIVTGKIVQDGRVLNPPPDGP